VRPDVIVLFSGGLDSTVLATMARRDGRLSACLVARYGQPHVEAETAAASAWCARHGAARLVLDVPIIGVEASMATGHGTPGPRVLPGRNLVLVAHAVQLAAARGCGEVWLGATAGDAADYPDCRAAFVEAASRAADAYGVRVVAPLVGMDKRAVVALGREIGADLDASWSCYQPRWANWQHLPCGTCNACIARADALGSP